MKTKPDWKDQLKTLKERLDKQVPLPEQIKINQNEKIRDNQQPNQENKR